MTSDEHEDFVRQRELPWTDCAFLLDQLDAARAGAAITALALRNILRSSAHLGCICDDCTNARRLLGEVDR